MTVREAQVAERLEKDRESTRERVAQHSMSRTSSRAASVRERDPPTTRTPPTASPSVASPSSPTPTSPKLPAAASANVRPSFSFANAAAGKKEPTAPASAPGGPTSANGHSENADVEAAVDEIAEKLEEVHV